MRSNDQLEDEQQLRRIRRAARHALQEADAIGVFPTPVDDIIDAASHSTITQHAIDERFIKTIGKKVGGSLKRALSKVLGVLDVRAKTIFLDKNVHAARRPFLKLHELGHGSLPWQQELYSLTADCEKTIDPDIADLFERESNAFASEVLFQLDGFTNEAAEFDFSIKTPLKLSKKYGASVYSTVRRYVLTNNRSCAVVVLEPPVLRDGDGFVANVRRLVASPTFAAQFGRLHLPSSLTPDDELGELVPLYGRKMSRPRAIALPDRNGDVRECIAEAFDSTHQVFILICAPAVNSRTIIIASTNESG